MKVIPGFYQNEIPHGQITENKWGATSWRQNKPNPLKQNSQMGSISKAL